MAEPLLEMAETQLDAWKDPERGGKDHILQSYLTTLLEICRAQQREIVALSARLDLTGTTVAEVTLDGGSPYPGR